MHCALLRNATVRITNHFFVPFRVRIFLPLTVALLALCSPLLSGQNSPASEPQVALDQSGTLEVLAIDTGRQSETKYYLNSAGSRIELPSVTTNLQTGAPVRVRGNLVSLNAITPKVDSAVPSPLTTTVPASIGNQTIAVLLVNFSDDTRQPFNASTVGDVVFNQTDAFYRENSQNQTWLSGQVFGYFTLPMSAASCNIAGIGDLADQAALQAGVDVKTYGHVLYVMSEPGCGFDGAAYLGGNRMWSNTDPVLMRVVGHELGHNLGLYHAHALNCSPATIASNCTIIDYGDLFDIMGDVTGSHFNAYEKEHLQYLTTDPTNTTSQKILQVDQAGTYTLEPYETTSNADGIKALKILKPPDSLIGNTYYYIEYRQGIGFDAALGQNYPDVFNGVLIHTGNDSNLNSSNLLDINAQTATFADAALPFGNKFVDQAAGITVTAVSGDSTEAQVKVDFSAAVCKTVTPVVKISPSTQTGTPGTELDYSVTITNVDTAGCNPQTFALLNSVVPGWSGSLSDTSFNLLPGASATTTLKVTSPLNAGAGNYAMYVKATGSSSGLVGFAQLTYSINVGLSLSVDSSSIVLTQGQGGFVTLSTTVGGSFNSDVGLTVSGVPLGVTATLSSTKINAPGAGTSILTFTVSSTTAIGTYTLNVTASGGGLTSQVSINIAVHASGDFTLSAVPTQVGVLQGTSGDATITSSLLGAFNGSVKLSVAGLPTGASAMFVPSTIAAPGAGKSTLTFTVGSAVPTGSYPLLVTGTSDLFTHSIAVSLVVGSATPPNPGPFTPIPQSGWTLKYADSQELSCAFFPAAFAFDGKSTTLWQTDSCLGTPPLPHEIRIDLGASYPIAGFRYLPRQDGSSVGKIANFEFYVSSDGLNWGTAQATGTLITNPTDVAQKEVVFASTVTGRYVRLRALTEVNGGKVTSAAEINVLQASTPPPAGGDFSLSATPPTLTLVQGTSGSTSILSTLTGSFSSSIALSVSGAPANVSTTFSPGSLAAPGSGMSSLTVNVGSSAAVGTYTLTVKGQSTTVAHSITLTLNITPSSPPVGNPTPIPQSGWKLKYADSQELSCGFYPAAFAFDGKAPTLWQTQSCIGTIALPHEIQIDLGATYSIKGFRYLPRQDGKSLGKIAQFEFYVSADGMTWGMPAATGSLITNPGDVAEKQVLFNSAVSGRYVRLRALSEVNGLMVSSAAELNVLQ